VTGRVVGTQATEILEPKIMTSRPFPRWVKIGKAQCEQMFSALPLEGDIAQCSRHVCFVPEAVIIRARLMPYIDPIFSC